MTNRLLPSVLLSLMLLGACADEPTTFDPGPDALDLRSVVFTGTEFVARQGLNFLHSADGRQWTRETEFVNDPYYLVASDGDGTVLGRSFPTTSVETELYLSTDARSWELVGSFSERIGSLFYGNGIWVGYDVPDRTLLRSTDGRNWTTTQLELLAPSRLTFAGGRFYLYSGSSAIRVSDDALVWTEVELPIESDMRIVALESVEGSIHVLAATFAATPDGPSPRSALFRIREVDGTWVRDQIGLDEGYTNVVTVGGRTLATSETQIVQLVDAELWHWETVVEANQFFGDFTVGNGAIVSEGAPAAVSLDDGETWSEATELAAQ